jgi:ABC-2 type transport system permease protein
MRIIDLALKDLLQVLHDRKALVFLVLMPVAFTLFFGFILSGSISDPRLPVGWINSDGESTLSADLFHLLEESNVIRLVPLEASQAGRASDQVRDEKLAAAVRVPPGFGAQAVAGNSIPITVIVLPGSPAGATASTAVQAAVNRLLSALTISQISIDTMETQQPFANPGSRLAYAQQALVLANQAWVEPSFIIQGDSSLETSGQAQNPNKGFLQSSPGMIVMFAILGLTTCSMVLFLERSGKTLERLLTTPIRPAEIIGGHLLAVFVVVFLQELMLASFGQLFFGVNYLREPFGSLLMMVALALWVASLGLLIGAISSSAEQVILWSLLAMFLFSALGGAWFPLEVAGKAFSTFGHITPAAWAMDGFQNIVLRGLGTVSTFLPAGALLAFALAFFALAVWRFRFE